MVNRRRYGPDHACVRDATVKVSAHMKRPGKSDPSRPREDGYDYKREFYRSSTVAEDYDFHRFSSPERQKRNRRKWAAICKALREATGVRTILDLPCGTGRFTGALAREGFEIVGSDISMEMLHKAASLETANKATGSSRRSAVTCRPMPNTCRCATTHSTASSASAS